MKEATGYPPQSGLGTTEEAVTDDPGAHEGDCAWAQSGLGCEQCEDFLNRLAEEVGHAEGCSYTLHATTPEIIAHLRAREPWCGGFWPDVAERLASEYGLSAARVRELQRAPRDQDGWPIGQTLTQTEYYMVQSLTGEDAQEKREEIATSDAIDALVEVIRSGVAIATASGLAGFSAADRGEDYASFVHAGHHFTAQIELDKEATS